MVPSPLDGVCRAGLLKPTPSSETGLPAKQHGHYSRGCGFVMGAILALCAKRLCNEVRSGAGGHDESTTEMCGQVQCGSWDVNVNGATRPEQSLISHMSLAKSQSDPLKTFFPGSMGRGTSNPRRVMMGRPDSLYGLARVVDGAPGTISKEIKAQDGDGITRQRRVWSR
ncbi:uncharacterized protein N7443_000942 [Penicillium atrosanguineum]|uniref:Uncharacterized protein n=1 Tax=Penicillium atrosanguineum TaxID=1132637 RepID=A0A9W9QE14_9EURO|nr:uncharacterized protein N7443_000942 [Penicillium atrosanguineum]KAJ5314058.1 hypothetical protein N7443_000942 [Penicillium atrosanguineum]KAJ5331224.1 hypothetical protein N7476_001007 [Penicillium atrosanguineum]